MTVVSHLKVQVDPANCEAAISAFGSLRVLERCSDVISGFKRGELLVSSDQPSQICIMTEWVNEAAYQQWMAHPLRAEQSAELAQFLAAPPQSIVFKRELEFTR